jgi:hypothetical protein
MKNAIVTGAIIGILSGLWMFIMHWLGFSPRASSMAQIEYVSVLIPLAGLYFGIRSYRATDCGGRMGFLEALIQSFKILLVAGVVTTVAAILYIDEIQGGGNNLMHFSERIFGALLVGILFAIGVSVLLTTQPNKVD